MSQDGKGQRIKVDISGSGFGSVAEKEASCGGKIYDGPAGGDYRKCNLGHTHCRRCGGPARRYGRADHSCINQCTLKEKKS